MTQTMQQCPTCQASIAADADVCESCGQEFCPDCAHALPADANACPSCGLEFAFLCPQCEEEIDEAAEICPHCSYSFTGNGEVTLIPGRSTTGQMTATDSNISGEMLGQTPDGVCPDCDTPVFKVDGYCDACGANYCPSCVGLLSDEGEEDECPHCGVMLYFDCPECQFELAAGTDLCPNCNTLFLSFCPACSAAVDHPLATTCTHCEADLVLEQREPARVLHTLVVDQAIVRLFGCTNCNTQFDSRNPTCPNCGQKVCPNCQLNLKEEEAVCPRCRPDIAQQLLARTTLKCPTCQDPITLGDEICMKCDQLLCPECATAVSESDTECPQCGIEFELICPECETVVSVESEFCPNCGEEL